MTKTECVDDNNTCVFTVTFFNKKIHGKYIDKLRELDNDLVREQCEMSLIERYKENNDSDEEWLKNELVHERIRGLLFLKGECLVGFATFRNIDADILGINTIVIDQEYQNKGLCSYFINKSLELKREMFGTDPKNVILRVMKDNKKAIKAYDRSGFKAESIMMVKPI